MVESESGKLKNEYRSISPQIDLPKSEREILNFWETQSIFHESVNDMPLGRNVNEYLRLIDAYTHVQEKGEVCPANWEEGKDAMTASRDGVANYLSLHKN